MPRLFISYSRKDADFARRLAADLERLGADVWIDVADIPTGMKWSSAVQHGLDNAELMLVVISPESMASVNVEDEWQYFLDQQRPVIPLLWRPAKVHFQLKRIQYIDFHTQDYALALQQLHTELGRNGVVLRPFSPVDGGEAQPVTMPTSQPGSTQPQPDPSPAQLSPPASDKPKADLSRLPRRTDDSGEIVSSVAKSSAKPKRRFRVSGAPSKRRLIASIALLGVLGAIVVSSYSHFFQFFVRTFTGHTNSLNSVNSVAFSPDGKMVLTGSGLFEVNDVALWDAQTGKQLRQFAGHTSGVNSVAFSLDGKMVLTGSGHILASRDNTARLWDAQTGQQLRQLTGHMDAVTSVAFAPDGKMVLTGSYDRTARPWDAATGRELRQFTGHTDGVSSVAFAPDGKTVLTGGLDFTAWLWDAATGQERRQLTGYTYSVSSVAFAPDGKFVLTGSGDHLARLWDAQFK